VGFRVPEDHGWLGFGGISTVRFPRDAFERLAVTLGIHQSASPLIALLPVAIRTLKLGPARYSPTAKAFSCVFCHFATSFGRLLKVTG
jgi:hypothetical protein